ncbi:hypothetical protein D3C71_1317410 [compost metagenome]
MWQNILLLNWTKNYTLEYQDEIQVLCKRGKDLIELIKKTNHNPVEVIIHKNEEAYKNYIKEHENNA